MVAASWRSSAAPLIDGYPRWVFSSTASRSVDGLLGLSVTSLLVGVGLGDQADSGHAVWRDPLSYFGASAAPYPLAFRVSLAAVGVFAGLWVVAHAAQLGRVVRLASGAAALSTVGLAVWPIDCSPVDDLCEVFIRGRVVSASHNTHSVFAVVLFVALAAIAVAVAMSISRAGLPSGWLGWIGAAVAVVSSAFVLLRPFAAGSGVAEVIAVVVAAIALRVECAGGASFARSRRER